MTEQTPKSDSPVAGNGRPAWRRIGDFLARPHARYGLGGILAVGIVFGVIGWGGFNWAMEMTNTETFCIGCHEMERNVYREYKKTIHYQNRTGVRATCPDCHVPKEWVHKVIRKIQATNELYHHFLGTIDNVQLHKWRVHTSSFIPKSRYLDSSIAEYIQNIPGNAGPQTVGIYLRRLNEIEAEASLRGEVTLGTLSCTHMHAWHLHSDAHVEGKGHLSPSIIVDGQVRYAYDSCAGLPLTGLTVKAGQQVYYVAYFEKRNDLPAMQSAILNDFTVTYWDKPRFVYRVWDSAR